MHGHPRPPQFFFMDIAPLNHAHSRRQWSKYSPVPSLSLHFDRVDIPACFRGFTFFRRKIRLYSSIKQVFNVPCTNSSFTMIWFIFFIFHIQHLNSGRHIFTFPIYSSLNFLSRPTWPSVWPNFSFARSRSPVNGDYFSFSTILCKVCNRRSRSALSLPCGTLFSLIVTSSTVLATLTDPLPRLAPCTALLFCTGLIYHFRWHLNFYYSRIRAQ